MNHEPGVGGAVSRARPGAEIVPPKNTGVRPTRSWQQAVVLRDNGTMAVADVQLCHGSAHSLLYHFLAGQNRGQFLSHRLRERKMQFLAEHGLRKSGAAREVYLTDPGEVPDPKQWKTQIVWPIAT